MKRLVEGLGKNSSEEYDRIYLERSEKEPDNQDMRRWKRLLKYYKGGRIADLGALDSQISQLVKDREDAIYDGYDISEIAVEDMKYRYGDLKNISFIRKDIYNMSPYISDLYDYVVLGEVIEHLEYPEKAIKEAIRILKVGGWLALSTPLEEEKEVGAKDKERHLWSFNVNDIMKMLKSYGKTKIDIMGSQYFPTYEYNWPNIIAYCKKK